MAKAIDRITILIIQEGCYAIVIVDRILERVVVIGIILDKEDKNV